MFGVILWCNRAARFQQWRNLDLRRQRSKERAADTRSGPAGAAGERGPAGQDGVSYEPPQFVGSQVCAECHQDYYDRFIQSGHPWIMNPVVDGQAPNIPGGNVTEPPEGLTWDDISYVIGGYNWKALFVNQDGYLGRYQFGTAALPDLGYINSS